MGSEYSQTESGLVLPSQGSDEAAVRRALKEHDPELVLLPPGVDVAGRPAPERVGYRVYRRSGGDRPLDFVCFWGNDQFDPYPLSSSLIDRVKELDRNTASLHLDELARDEIRRQEIAATSARDQEALAADWATPHGRPVLHRSQSLRLARDKQRAKGKKV